MNVSSVPTCAARDDQVKRIVQVTSGLMPVFRGEVFQYPQFRETCTPSLPVSAVDSVVCLL